MTFFDPFHPDDGTYELAARYTVQKRQQEMFLLALDLEMLNHEMQHLLDAMEITDDEEEKQRINRELDKLEKRAERIVAKIEDLQRHNFSVQQQKMLFQMAFQELDRRYGNRKNASSAGDFPGPPLDMASGSSGSRSRRDAVDGATDERNDNGAAQGSKPEIRDRIASAGVAAGIAAGAGMPLFLQYQAGVDLANQDFQFGWMFWASIGLGLFVGGIASGMMAEYFLSRSFPVGLSRFFTFCLSGLGIALLLFELRFLLP